MKEHLSALRKAPLEHRVIAFSLFAVAWYVLENVLQYHNAAKGVELLGLGPFADRVLTYVIGE